MGLFDFFKKKDSEKSLGEDLNTNKVLNQDPVNTTEIKIVTQYDFKGINYELVNKLYFIDEEQKVKLLKFVNIVIDEFKLNEIKTFEDLKKFDSSLDKYYEFIEKYEDKYNDDPYFPYFFIKDLVYWDEKEFTEVIKNGKVTETSELKMRTKMDEVPTEVYIFNIKNKIFNTDKNIEFEESAILAKYKEGNAYKSYDILDPFESLINFYLKNKDYDKVATAINLLIQKLVPEDRNKLSHLFSQLLNEEAPYINITDSNLKSCIEACEYTIRHKFRENIYNIAFEEKIIIDAIKLSESYRYQNIYNPLMSIVDVYCKNSDFNSIDNLLNLISEKTIEDDRNKIESAFEYIGINLSKVNEPKAIEYLMRGIDFLKSNFPKPKFKSMGGIYKTLVQILFEQKEFQKAMQYITEGELYNENLSFKQIRAKIEKNI